MHWSASAIEDVQALFEYLSEHPTLWDAEHVTGRSLICTDLVFLVIAVIAMRWSNRDVTVKTGTVSVEMKTLQQAKE